MRRRTTHEEELEARVGSQAQQVAALQDTLTKKDEEMRVMEERYKRYLEKCKSVSTQTTPQRTGRNVATQTCLAILTAAEPKTEPRVERLRQVQCSSSILIVPSDKPTNWPIARHYYEGDHYRGTLSKAQSMGTLSTAPRISSQSNAYREQTRAPVRVDQERLLGSTAYAGSQGELLKEPQGLTYEQDSNVDSEQYHLPKDTPGSIESKRFTLALNRSYENEELNTSRQHQYRAKSEPPTTPTGQFELYCENQQPGEPLRRDPQPEKSIFTIYNPNKQYDQSNPRPQWQESKPKTQYDQSKLKSSRSNHGRSSPEPGCLNCWADSEEAKSREPASVTMRSKAQTLPPGTMQERRRTVPSTRAYTLPQRPYTDRPKPKPTAPPPRSPGPIFTRREERSTLLPHLLKMYFNNN